MPPYLNTAALFTVSQKAILTDKKGRVLMMAKAGKSHWDLPGGKLDEGEEMQDGIARELYEETRLQAVSFDQIIHVGRRSFDEDGKPERIMIFYLCKTKQSFKDIKLSSEHTEWRLMAESDITDSDAYEINPVVRAALTKVFKQGH